MHATARRSRPKVALALAVALAVAAVQFWFVAVTASDIPFDDQWGLEGAWLYPCWLDGSLEWTDLFRPHNEHRIAWTHTLNLALFTANGQWDPLVQIAALVVLRAAVAGVLVAMLISAGGGRTWRWSAALAVLVLFLPHLSWHNVQWGFQTQVYFSLGFALLALWLLGTGEPSTPRFAGGMLAGVAAQFAMGAGALVPVALGAAIAIDGIARRKLDRAQRRRLAAVLLLGALAWLLRTSVPEHAALRPATAAQFLGALGRSLAWPYPGIAAVALLTNLPLAWLVVARGRGRVPAMAGAEVALLLGLFGAAGALSQAALRGGGVEFAARVPSRYADFLVPLVLANGWCAAACLGTLSGARWRSLARIAALGWLVVVALGWMAASAEAWNGMVRWRRQYRDLPAELVRAYQVSGDPEVFIGYRRLFVPSDSPGPMRRVLDEPRMNGKLPPSLQPERPLGPLSVVVRWARAQLASVLALAGLGVAAFFAWAWRAERAGDATPVRADAR